MRKFLLLNFILVFALEFCHAASIIKDTQADFTVSGSLFENTIATVEPGSIVLKLSGVEPLWITNGVTISAAANDQENPQVISDGSGGAIIVWQDKRNGVDYDIYAQRIDRDGNIKWTENGVAICTEVNDQLSPNLVTDGSGGAIIVWQDGRSGNKDIYAQKVDSSGNVQWTVNGVAICTAANDQSNPQLSSDEGGGAIITWYDNRGGDFDIYVQKVDAGGNVKWAANGVAICTAAGTQIFPRIVKDGNGGAIITWYDRRGANYDIYAQKVDSNGNVQWTTNGVTVCASGGDQETPYIVSDGNGGAIIAWRDTRDWGTTGYDIYAQRVNNNGVIQWTTSGVAICAVAGHQITPKIISDNNNGAIIVWQDPRGSDDDIYARRIDNAGNPQWRSDGIPVCDEVGDQGFHEVIADGNGGAIVVWGDGRNDVGIGNADIYAQAIDGSGRERWVHGGIAVCAENHWQYYPRVSSDGSGGAIIAWVDQRGVVDNDIYAQRISDVYFPSGRYTTEKIVNTDPSFEGWTTLSWVGQGSITAEVKTSTSSIELDSVAWVPVVSGGDIPNRGNENYRWIQVRMYLSSGDLKTTTATLESLSINYETKTPTPTIEGVVYGPNPFNPLIENTFIIYQLSADVETTIFIFNTTGELIYKQKISPPNEGAHIGYNRVTWEGRNHSGEIVSNGIYLFKVVSGGKTIGSGKIMVIK